MLILPRNQVDQKRDPQLTLDLLSRILKENPEYATRWNDRRRVIDDLLSTKGPNSDDAHERIRGELAFLVPLLMQFPKCYSIWEYRIWILHVANRRLTSVQAHQLWQEELALDSKMLGRDPRNFHGWDYRRLVVAQLEHFAARETQTEALCESEFAYTMALIRKNFSNFSAWHNRSRLIPAVLDYRDADHSTRRKMFDEELAFVKDAVMLDPYDQSLWYYHEYLMSVLLSPPKTWVNFSNADRETVLRGEISVIRELLDDDSCTDCKWIYQRLLSLSSSYLQLDGGTKLVTTQDLRSWLDTLQKLDPMRSGRWKDLRTQLNV